ncbi:unnamed protein product [Arabis nemorensis]|uniref:Uncharacterized protein n=1 Tax=Arabis nemorensis TaxID=586526 RepID=A0A565BBY5_9BRAS|nr:unnamed protein product [Arabis nemorensis]
MIQVHTKKRNRLDVSRMNSLVYVQFNAKLMSQRKNREEKNIDMLLADHATNPQSWIVDGIFDDERDSESSLQGDIGEEESHMDEVRELDEEEFISDDEEEEHIDYESDGNLVLEVDGEEEYED